MRFCCPGGWRGLCSWIKPFQSCVQGLLGTAPWSPFILCVSRTVFPVNWSISYYFLWHSSSWSCRMSDEGCFVITFWLWAVEDRAEGQEGTGLGDSPSILHNTSAAWFIFNPVYRNHPHLVLQLLFFPCEKDVCVLSLWEFPDIFFPSNFYDLQLWRGFQSCNPQQLFSWRKSSFLSHHPHQKPWRSLYQKGLFLCLRYSQIFGKYCLPIFPSPGFGRALSVSREIPGHRNPGCLAEILWRQGINKLIIFKI